MYRHTNWLILLFLTLLPLLAFSVTGSHKTPLSHLNQIYRNHRFTFFCDQPFSAKNEVTFQPCSHCPTITKKIQWMPIVPLWQLAQHLNCYQEKTCINSKGQTFKGLRCCQQVNSTYQQMSVDLHNFAPEIPLLRQQRRRFTFGLVSDQKRNQASCHLYIDQKQKCIEPAPEIRGIIARTYLYMRDTYHFPLSEKEAALFLAWHQEYPVSEWERERNKMIQTLQGKGNRYIS
ncbi:MAG: endonuclease [Candidatus Berkiellales bacterium]